VDDDLVGRVRRPTQYLGGEVNAVVRDDPSLIRFALAFPDTYELGMSHLGLKILYRIINGEEGFAAERVFAPEADMEELLRREGRHLTTLETGRPLGACHLVGFTLQSELHCTTILAMLELGGIPVLAAERGDGDPLVLGGGPLAMNPEPVADFFDALALGDGEEVVREIARHYRNWRGGGAGRRELLRGLARIPGVYVPSLYRVSYGPGGEVADVQPGEEGIPATVSRRVVRDLDRCPIPTAPPVPFLESTHDRFTVEVARGCIRGCRFCHAGMVYRPYRERRAATVLAGVREGLAATGYEEVSLSALSTGDWCSLAPVTRELARTLRPSFISISLPSIRPGSLPDDVIRDVGAVRKGGFTIAPEAGNDRMRRMINKGISDREILETARHIFRNGWQSLKLYFMIGLPGETPEDLDSIITLASAVRRAAQEEGVKRPHLTVSVSSFVPKPHTPFQWSPMAPPSHLEETVARFQKACRQHHLSFKWHHPGMSLVEGILSRGDRRLGRVIQAVWRRGGTHQAWSDRFDPDLWLTAMREEGLDPAFYTSRERPAGETFPWDHLLTGVGRDFLLRELQRSRAGEPTPPCRPHDCRTCGACDEGTLPLPAADSPPAGDAPSEPEPSPPRRFRLRLRFAKTGALRYLSHLELFRAFYRACRRANLPLSFSEGFNPHPRISFAPPLPVGVEGEGELVDVELAAPFPAAGAVEALNATMPAGIRFSDARYLATAAPSLFESVQAAHWRIALPPGPWCDPDGLRARLEELLAQEHLFVLRDKGGGKANTKEVRRFILSASLREDGSGPGVDLWTRFTTDGTIRPGEFLRLLLPDLPGGAPSPPMKRLGLYRLEQGRPTDLLSPSAPPR
jgi:radical SAM family uncharacterized protein/radical SAM-linked protein